MYMTIIVDNLKWIGKTVTLQYGRILLAMYLTVVITFVYILQLS